MTLASLPVRRHRLPAGKAEEHPAPLHFHKTRAWGWACKALEPVGLKPPATHRLEGGDTLKNSAAATALYHNGRNTRRQLTHQWAGGDSVVRYEYDSEGPRTTMRTFSSLPALSNLSKFDISGYRSASSAAILIYPNGGSGQTPDYQPRAADPPAAPSN